MPDSLAIQAGNCAEAIELQPTVILVGWAEATEKESGKNRLTAKITAFIGSSFSNPKFKILPYPFTLLLTPHPCALRFTESPCPLSLTRLAESSHRFVLPSSG